MSGCGCDARPVALASRTLGRLDAHWTDGAVTTVLGEVPRVRPRLDARDWLGTLAARTAIGRMRYRVPPGLYALGAPNADSPVLVSANYKLSFDHLRRSLGARDAWILVLDTRGINVWCAAGKGTFGTAELVGRLRATGLARLVAHRKLVVPQLGGPGIAAHEVRQATGFHVVYGPVRAADLPAFLDARMKATPEMRRVRFRLRDRMTLVPVELVTGAKFVLPVAAAFLLLGGLGRDGYSLARLGVHGVQGAALVLVSALAALVLGPALLPWLPGRAFSLKGAWIGLALVAAVALAAPASVLGAALPLAAWLLLAPAITSFGLMNFTGTSTFTSLSGVLREMRYALPAQIAASALGVVLWLCGLFLPGGS